MCTFGELLISSGLVLMPGTDYHGGCFGTTQSANMQTFDNAFFALLRTYFPSTYDEKHG